jgi:hypothetical protein
MPSRILLPTGGLVRAALVGALILFAAPARAGDRYYVIIFGSQSTPKLPRYTHTWATFIRACDDDGDVSRSPLQVDTISWFAVDMEVRPFRLRAEPGRNFDLETTLHAVFATRQRVSEWGPYEITPKFYEEAMRQKARLESGQVKYKAIDPTFGPRAQYISNCIHAITDLDPNRGRLYYSELRRNGEEASHFAASRLLQSEGVVNRGQDLGWIEERLGLDRYPIVDRPYPEHGSRWFGWLRDR